MRWVWLGFAVLAVIAVCGFTLYWTQSKIDAISEQVASMDRTVKVMAAQASTSGTVSGTDPEASAPVTTPPSADQAVRLARIVKCDVAGNQMTVTYDPAQLFTGADAVNLAASLGEVVTNGSYLFDPSHDVFTGAAPVKTGVTVHQVPAGWEGPAPTSIAELSADLQGSQGQTWMDVYFWLSFKEGYLVAVEQYQTGESGR